MESLSDIDDVAYKMYNGVNTRYQDFVSRQYNESGVRNITDKKGGHEIKLTSDEAVKKIWTNGDSQGIRRFMRNFNEDRNGLDDYLVHADNENISGADAFAIEASRGVKAMQDIIYTDMAAGLRGLDMKVHMDPVARLDEQREYVRKYLIKHKSKLIEVPGFEDNPGALKSILEDLGAYKLKMKELDEQKNLGILANITGPGNTIMDIAGDPVKAREMASMIDSMSIPKEGPVDVTTAALSGEQIRKTLYNGLMQKHTTGNSFDGEGMLRLLNGESRYNLQLVLGEQQVMKLEAMARISNSLKTGETTLSESLSSDALLKGLDSVGFGLGRMGSMLSRRVAFQPSTGYLAGSMMAKLLDQMTQKQTARSLKVLMDNPFDLMEMDNFILKSIDGLTEQKKAIVDRSLANRNLKGLVGWFDKVAASSVHAHLSSLGYKVTETELETMFKEHFLTETEETKEPKETKATPDTSTPDWARNPDRKRGISAEEEQAALDAQIDNGPAALSVDVHEQKQKAEAKDSSDMSSLLKELTAEQRMKLTEILQNENSEGKEEGAR